MSELTLQKYSTGEIETAAIKIQKFFLNKYEKYKKKIDNKKDVCSTEDVLLELEPEVKADNIYICFNNKDKKEIPLVNFFRFKEKEDLKAEIFTELYNYMYKKVEPQKRIVYEVELIENYLYIDPHSDIYKDSILNEHAHRFIFYNLINLKNIDLSKKIRIQINHPKNFSEITAGMHKDHCTYTSITYIKSPVTTEIAFETKTIKLDWLTCSPLFRFNTSEQITTLCFSDHYINHTAPVYEAEGKEPNEVNSMDTDENMIYTGVNDNLQSHIEFGYIKDHTWHNQDTFLKHVERQKVQPPKDRKILLLNTYEEDQYKVFWKDIDFICKNDYYDINELRKKYEIQSVEEKLELSEDNVKLFIFSKSLGDFYFIGGINKNKTKRIKKILGKRGNSKYSSKKNKTYNIRKTKKTRKNGRFTAIGWIG